MKKIFLIIVINCVLSIAGSAQFYTYFDSLYYPAGSENAFTCRNILTQENNILIGSAGIISGNGRPYFVSCNTDGSNPEYILPNAPLIHASGWYGPQYITTSDGGYLFSDITSSIRSHVIKYSETFDTLWTYTAEIQDSVILLYQPLEVADGYLICGAQALFNSNPMNPYPEQLLIMKLDFDGHLMWRKLHDVYNETVDGQQLWFMRFSGIFELDNGDIILSGARYAPMQPFIARLDSAGENLQMYEFGELEFPDWMPWLVPLENHQFMVGYAYSDAFDSNTFTVGKSHLMLFDADQMLPTWDTPDTNITWYGQFIMDMIQTNDGGYATCGYHLVPPFQYEGFIQKWSSSGIVEWTKYYNHLPDNDNHFSQFYDIASTQDGGYLLCGSYRYGNNPERGWVLKVDACGDIQDLGCPVSVQEVTAEKQGLIVWPVPASERLNVQTVLPGGQWSLCISDMFGHLIKTEQRSGLHNAQSIAIQNLPAGVYLLTASDEKGQHWTKKFVVENNY